MFSLRIIISLLREINARIAHMALDTTKLTAIVATLSGNVTTLVSIARKNATNPADQAAIDAIEQSLEGLNTSVAQADSDLAPPATPPPPAPPLDVTGSTGPAA